MQSRLEAEQQQHVAAMTERDDLRTALDREVAARRALEAEISAIAAGKERRLRDLVTLSGE